MSRLRHGTIFCVLVIVGCKSRDAVIDAGVVDAGPPARLAFAGNMWVYDRAVPKRAVVHFNNATKEVATIRMPSGESFRVAPGGHLALSTPMDGFTFDRVHTDGSAETMGPHTLSEGATYIYDIDAIARFEITTQGYSAIGIGGVHGPLEQIAGAFLFSTTADFILEPLPPKVELKPDEVVVYRTSITRTYDANATCKHLRADAGETASLCAIAPDEWTLQVNGEGDVPSATAYVDNAYADAIELRIDHVSLGTVKSASVSRIHLSPKTHVLAAYSSSGTLREETTQKLGDWKRYVWAPEKRRSYLVEKRDYGTSFAIPGMPVMQPTAQRIDKPGFFETDADFLFEPFPESIEASQFTVGATRKRLVRIGVREP